MNDSGLVKFFYGTLIATAATAAAFCGASPEGIFLFGAGIPTVLLIGRNILGPSSEKYRELAAKRQEATIQQTALSQIEGTDWMTYLGKKPQEMISFLTEYLPEQLAQELVPINTKLAQCEARIRELGETKESMQEEDYTPEEYADITRGIDGMIEEERLLKERIEQGSLKPLEKALNIDLQEVLSQFRTKLAEYEAAQGKVSRRQLTRETLARLGYEHEIAQIDITAQEMRVREVVGAVDNLLFATTEAQQTFLRLVGNNPIDSP